LSWVGQYLWLPESVRNGKFSIESSSHVDPWLLLDNPFPNQEHQYEAYNDKYGDDIALCYRDD
jgi:hypothetical protein